jgi:hypothetical protein
VESPKHRSLTLAFWSDAVRQHSSEHWQDLANRHSTAAAGTLDEALQSALRRETSCFFITVFLAVDTSDLSRLTACLGTGFRSDTRAKTQDLTVVRPLGCFLRQVCIDIGRAMAESCLCSICRSGRRRRIALNLTPPLGRPCVM